MLESAAGILDREAQIGLNLYWRAKRYDYSGCNVTYIGMNRRLGAETTEGTWAVWKLTYSGNKVVFIEGPITGAWDSRATLDWN
jgi:hypothetical protein